MITEEPDSENSGQLERIELAQGLMAAVACHDDWVWAINRAILCRQPAAEALLRAPCSFEKWCLSAAEHPVLGRYPELSLLIEDHETIHRILQRLGRREGPVDAELYDRLLAVRHTFKARVQRLEERLWTKACHADALTGLRNRHGMYAELREEQQRALRERRSCVLAMMDMDHFKAVNDRHGHLVGDTVLRVLTRSATDRLRPYDRIYRYGGEEFLICLPDTDLRQARHIIERLRAEIAGRPIEAHGRRISVTVSFGLALLDLAEPVEVSIERADGALYRAKDAGRNCVMVEREAAEGWSSSHPPPLRPWPQ